MTEKWMTYKEIVEESGECIPKGFSEEDVEKLVNVAKVLPYASKQTTEEPQEESPSEI